MRCIVALLCGCLCICISTRLVTEGAAIALPFRSHHGSGGGGPTAAAAAGSVVRPLAQKATAVLVPIGKGAAGVAIGFFGYRLAIRSIKKTVEVAAAVVIAVVVIRVTAIMDHLPVSAEWNYKFFKLKQEIRRTAQEYGQEVRRHLHEEGVEGNVKAFFQRERMAAYGVVGGVIAALIV